MFRFNAYQKHGKHINARVSTLVGGTWITNGFLTFTENEWNLFKKYATSDKVEIMETFNA